MLSKKNALILNMFMCFGDVDAFVCWLIRRQYLTVCLHSTMRYIHTHWPSLYTHFFPYLWGHNTLRKPWQPDVALAPKLRCRNRCDLWEPVSVFLECRADTHTHLPNAVHEIFLLGLQAQKQTAWVSAASRRVPVRDKQELVTFPLFELSWYQRDPRRC